MSLRGDLYTYFNTKPSSDRDHLFQRLLEVPALIYSKDAADALAATETTHYFYDLNEDVEILGVSYTPDDVLTADDTDFATIAMKWADGAGGSATTIASLTTETSESGGTGDWTAGTLLNLALVAAQANRSAGNTLIFSIAKDASGVAVPAGTLTVHIRKR